MKSIISFLLLLNIGVIYAQCSMKPIPLDERIQIADLVIEGQVINQQSFEPDGSSMILTRNTIEITKVFKSNFSNTTPTTIDIITKGGTLGLRADKVTTALELFKNDKGIFTLQSYQNGTYQAIAGSQSLIRYSQPDYKAYSALKQWENIDTSLFNEITSITGVAFQSVSNIDFAYSPSILKMGTPLISNISPLSVNAGVGDVITITGSGFGSTQGNGIIVFANADDGGSLSVTPDVSQIDLWSDTEIRVQVPSGAGNGVIAILEDTGNFDISTQQILVGYNHVNFTFALTDGVSNFNVVAEVSLYDNNNVGGYDFNYSSGANGFIGVPDASTTLDDIYEKWRCTTGVNFVRGSDLATNDPANTDNPENAADNINVVKFDGSDLPAGSGVLAFVLTRAAACITNNELVAYVSEMDVVINDEINWHFRDNGTSSTSLDNNEFDFESVMLHEIGHAQQLGHVIDGTKVMHFALANGSMRRSIDVADIEGATYINDKSTTIAPCSNSPMQYSDCGFIYSSSNWTPFDPSGTNNPNSTITVQNGIVALNEDTGTKDITVASNASLNITGNNTLMVNGNILNNGTAAFDHINMSGATNQSISGNMVTIDDFELSNPTTIDLNTDIEVTTRFNNDGSTINTNGNLILKSTVNGTAHVDEFEGTINGDVIVERYYPSQRAFRFISPTVTTTSSIYENWQENGVFTTGLGTHISGSSTGANGFDATTSGNPSLFLYDNTGVQGWSAITSTNDPSDILVAGNAYRLFVRGDRDPNLLTMTSSSETTLRTTGELATGNLSGPFLSPVANTFGFIGNPYQAPVDMETVLTRSGSNLAPTYYVWDPNLSTSGAYVALNTVTGVSSNMGSPANKYAQPHQAFFVQTASNGAASINFIETDKAIDQGNVSVNSVPASMRINAILKNGTDLSNLDGFTVLFDNNFSNAIGNNDAQKLLNINESIGVVQSNTTYSIAERALPLNQEIIGLNHSNYQTSSYVYSFNLTGSTLNAYLLDRHTNMRHTLINNTINDITFTVDPSSASSIATDRFAIEFSNITLSNLLIDNNLFQVFPNPNNGLFNIQMNESGEAQLEIFNLLGQVVYQTELLENDIHSIETNLSTGNYIIKISQNGHSTIEKIIIE